MAANSVSRLAPDRVVTVPVADMFSSPTEQADVVSQAIIGSNVTTLDLRDDWARVRTDDGYAGWMCRGALRDLENLVPYAASDPAVRIDSLFANVYREPNVRARKPILTIPFDSQLVVEVREAAGEADWTPVLLPDQSEGWIRSDDGDRSLDPLTIAQTVELAKRFVGLPYLWGGRSSFGFDCSGFTQMLVRRRGIIMPRDAILQAEWAGAIEVSRSDLIPGDLVFFGPSLETINHTALYIGDGAIIHSTVRNRPGVQIGLLEDPMTERNLVACRRILESLPSGTEPGARRRGRVEAGSSAP